VHHAVTRSRGSFPSSRSRARSTVPVCSAAMEDFDFRNTIWSGCVATGTDREDGPTAFIREHNRLLAEDTRYVGSIVRFGTA
jgi:hypothetical protein